MEKIDYKKVGLKCGIEIHQQLDTHKLFCDCPSDIRDDKHDIEVRRELRAVAGETGKIDAAASHEMAKQKYYVYQAYSDSTCLVELDDEPPHSMNQEALNTVLQVSKMLNSKVVDEIQVMRKTVVDGSNTSGFQRTSLIARKGFLESKDGRIGIQTVCLEEDAAKIIERKAGYDVYNLTKLGIPLAEIATDPDIFSPEQCQEVAGKIGMILRSTGKVKRGLGTIRQDVNVSVKGGNRIEIKGAQDLKMIPTLVEYEARRQLNLIKIKDKCKNLTLIKDKYEKVTKIFSKTTCKFMANAVKKGNDVFAFRLPGCEGILGHETQPGKRFGTELSDYGKLKAGIGGIMHSDEDMKKYTFTDKEVTELKKTLGCKEKDAFIIMVDKEEKIKNAVNAIVDRIEVAKKEIPKEVRKANADGTSSYMRPMPGAARMYPETDVVPVKVSKAYIDKIEIPELLEEKKDRFIKDHKTGEDLANLINKAGIFDIFEEFVEKYSQIKPAFIAETLLATPKQVKAKINKEVKISTDQFSEIFKALSEGKISKDSVFDIIVDIANNKFDLNKYKQMSDKELEKQIKKLITEKKGLDPKVLTGIAIGQLKSKAEPKKIIQILNKLLGS